MNHRQPQQQQSRPYLLGIVFLGVAAVLGRRVVPAVLECFPQHHHGPSSRPKDRSLDVLPSSFMLDISETDYMAALVVFQGVVRGVLQRSRKGQPNRAPRGMEEDEERQTKSRDIDFAAFVNGTEENSNRQGATIVKPTIVKTLEQRICALEAELSSERTGFVAATEKKAAGLRARDKTIQALTAEKKAVETQLESLSASWTTEKKHLEDKVKRLEAVNEKEGKESGAASTIQGLTREKEDLARQLRSASSSWIMEKKVLEDEVRRLKAQKGEELKTLQEKEKLETAGEEKLTKQEGRDKTIQVLTLEKDEFKKQLASYSESQVQEKRDLEEGIQTLEAENEFLIKNLHEQEETLKEKMEELEDCRNTIDELSREKEILENQLETLSKSSVMERVALEHRLNTMMEEKEEETKTLWKQMEDEARAQLEATVEGKSLEFSESMKALEVTKDGEINNMKEKHEALMEEKFVELGDLNQKIEALAAEKQTLQKQLDSSSALWTKEKSELQAQMSKLGAEYNEEIANLRKQLELDGRSTEIEHDVETTAATESVAEDNVAGEWDSYSTPDATYEMKSMAPDFDEPFLTPGEFENSGLMMREMLDTVPEEGSEGDERDHLIQELTLEKENLQKQLDTTAVAAYEEKSQLEERLERVEIEKDQEIISLKEQLAAIKEDNGAEQDNQDTTNDSVKDLTNEFVKMEKQDADTLLETNSVTSMLSRHQQLMLDESASMLEYLREEIVKLRSQNKNLRRDFDSLKSSNEKLMAANNSANSSFVALHKHAKELAKKNEDLSAETQKQVVVAENLKEELKIKQSTYVTEVHSRMQCHTALRKMQQLVQDRCDDTELMNKVQQVADEYDSLIRTEFISTSY